MRRLLRGSLANLLLTIGGLCAGLFAIEGLIALALSRPGFLSGDHWLAARALNIARQYYMTYDRAIVQLEPECYRYDDELTYTLRTDSTCRVFNREHTVEYRSNRQGLRGANGSLANPKIVVLGDSHAMGWGVAEAEAFPMGLEQRVGLPVLNAAMSSYGTARELALIERLRLPDFPILIIQYCDNDFPENRFLIDKGKLELTSEPQFRAFLQGEAARRRYRILKHSRELFQLARESWRRPVRRAENTDAQEARYFLEVLLRHDKLLAGKAVIVLEINGNNLNDSRFTSALSAHLAQPRYTSLKDAVIPLDLSNALANDDYYVLDDHMKPAGHAKVARLIAEELRQRSLVARP